MIYLFAGFHLHRFHAISLGRTRSHVPVSMLSCNYNAFYGSSLLYIRIRFLLLFTTKLQNLWKISLIYGKFPLFMENFPHLWKISFINGTFPSFMENFPHLWKIAKIGK